VGIGAVRILHVKLPVTDLVASVTWYRRLLDADVFAEFVEDGVLQGAALRVPDGGFSVALRNRAACATQPDLSGLDVVAVQIDTRASLDALIARCDRLGVAHRPLEERPDGNVVDVPDPDGTVLRFYQLAGQRPEFEGVTFTDGVFAGVYDQPRLG